MQSQDINDSSICIYLKFTKSSNGKRSNIPKVPLHAFVQFSTPSVVKEAVRLSIDGKLIFCGHALKVKIGIETSSRMRKRRTTPLFIFSPVLLLEIGSLPNLNEFSVAWRAPTSCVDFHVDPFDRRCRIFLTQDQLFTFTTGHKGTLIKFDFKIEFLIKDIRNVRIINGSGTKFMMLQLWVAPRIYYRTAYDDIYVSVPFPLLDDEDHWIQTLDFTSNNALGRCLAYKIDLSPRDTLKEAIDYFKHDGLLDGKPLPILKIDNEPYLSSRGIFFTLPHCPKIPSETMFLLNALVHKGIVNYQRITPEFYNLLDPGVTPTKLSTPALRHMLS